MNEFDSVQLEKIANFREQGIESYPHGPELAFDVREAARIIHEANFQSVRHLSDIEMVFAGRIRFKNEMGNLGFARIQAADVMLQVMISKKEVGSEVYKGLWKRLDVGDSVFVRGTLMRTRMGELTLRVSELTLASKCIKGMPDKVTGVTDSETLQRQRYLDLMVNDDSYQRFVERSRLIGLVRYFLINHGFLEVETPVLQPIPGGATAKPFTTHHNALDRELYMRVAPELYLKRLIVGGMPRVFEIGKNFRNEGISTKHNPEFTMVEFYSSYTDYRTLMRMTEELITSMARTISDDLLIPYGEQVINYNEWNEVRYLDAIASLMSEGLNDPWNVQHLRTYIWSMSGRDMTDIPTEITQLWDIIFDEFIEPTLINPTFVTHYPVEISPLARRNDEDPRVTDRFELFIGTYEVANAFNELNDPVEQAERFAEQARRKADGDDEAMYFDDDFINALSYGMPPTAGEGIGLDRLIMLLTNSSSIRDVILFPTKR
jgi:lysyl-tRNA synthetase class 2